jgi:Sec-independent protein translocase protein TatA
MDSFFGIGLPEFILIMIIAGIVMGPERIAKTARWLGKTSAQLQAISRGFVRQLNAEIEAADQGGEFKGAMREMQELQRQVAELKSELKTVAQSAVREPRQSLEAARREAEQTIRPPSFPALNEPGNGSAATQVDSNDEANNLPTVYQPPSLVLPKRLDVDSDPD